jgi:hypothetical protein
MFDSLHFLYSRKEVFYVNNKIFVCLKHMKKESVKHFLTEYQYCSCWFSYKNISVEELESEPELELDLEPKNSYV